MPTFAAVTTCNELGYEQYGRRMIESFDLHWPPDVKLHVYAEGFVPDRRSARIVYHDLHTECPDLVAFKRRHADNAAAHGRAGRKRWRMKVDWARPKLRARRVDWGLGYWWDAVRFSHKAFAIFHAARTARGDVLFWIDADIRVFADVPADFVAELMPKDCLLSYLARPKFSECGFVGYNLRHHAIGAFIDDFEALYKQDLLFRQREFHDSYLFDVIRRRFERRGCQTYDIAQGMGREAGHVFVNSPLGRYMDHMKGERKAEGASCPSDLIASRPEAYWHAVAK